MLSCCFNQIMDLFPFSSDLLSLSGIIWHEKAVYHLKLQNFNPKSHQSQSHFNFFIVGIKVLNVTAKTMDIVMVNCKFLILCCSYCIKKNSPKLWWSMFCLVTIAWESKDYWIVHIESNIHTMSLFWVIKASYRL